MAAFVALLMQMGVAHADTTADINAALSQLSFSTNVTTATPDQLRQAIARAVFNNSGASTPAAAASIASTYFTEVLTLRYPTSTGSSSTITANYLNRASNAAVIFNGAVQGLRGLSIIDGTAYASLTTAAAATALYQPAGATATQIAKTDTTKAAIAGAVVTQLNTVVSVKLTGSSATALAKDPALAASVAPSVVSNVLGTYSALDDNRNSQITSAVLKALPAVTAGVFTQANRDAAIGAVATTVSGSMVDRDEFVARLAKADALSILVFSKTIAAGLADDAARVAFAAGAADFFKKPNGSPAADLPNIVLLDTTKALLAAGIAQASPSSEGAVAAAVANTMSQANLTSSQAALATNALDLRRATVLASVTKLFPASAPAITTQYLVAAPIVDASKAPAFATTVVKSLPVVVNTQNRDAFATTTTAVTAGYIAAAVSDANFNTKAGVTRAVVVAVATFAEETVKQVALQVGGDLNYAGLNPTQQATLAATFAAQVANNSSGLANVTDATKALIARGVALAFVEQAPAVARAVADLPLFSNTASTPTAASRAAIAAAVSKAVPTAASGVAGEVALSITGETNKIAFGAALIPLLPATSGVTNAAKAVAAGIATNFADDASKIVFATNFAKYSAATKAATVSGLIAGGVASQLSAGSIATNAPLLAAEVAGGVNVAATASVIAAEVARVAAVDIADDIALAVAQKTITGLTDVNRTAIASAVVTVKPAAAASVAGSIAGTEADASKAALTTAVAKIVYSDPAAVANVAVSVANAVVAGNTPVSGVSPADTIRQGIAQAALKSAMPTAVNDTNAASVNAVAVAVAQSIAALQTSATSKANLANALVLSSVTYAAKTVGSSTIPGNIASTVAQSVTDPADKAAVANAATKASLAQAVNIATAVALRGAGTVASPLPVNDATKALVAQKVVLAAGPTSAVNVANAIVALVSGDAVSVDQAKANVAGSIVVSAPTQAAALANAVALPLGDAGKILVATAVVQGLPIANAVSAGPVAKIVADQTTATATKSAIAAAATGLVPAQAVTIATNVALLATPAAKASIAAAVAGAIPSGSQASVSVGVAIVAREVAKQILVSSPTAAADIAAIAKAVAGVSTANASTVAGTVALNFVTTLPSAAVVIADQVAQVASLTIADRAAVAKSVAAAVVTQATLVSTTVLDRALNIDNGTTTPDSVAATFAGQIPAQAAKLAGTATSYLAAHPSSTKAGDIAVAVATAPNVLKTTIPAIATEVAQAIFPTKRQGIGGIADKFAYATTASSLGNGNLSPANYLTNVAALATNLATVAAPTAHESNQLAGIVAALAEGISPGVAPTAANMAMMATVAKNVAAVAITYWGPSYKADDLVGFLVQSLIDRGVSNSLATGSVLASLRTALTSTQIPITTINAVLGTGPTASLNPAYAALINGSGIGTIGDVLSQTTPVTNF